MLLQVKQPPMSPYAGTTYNGSLLILSVIRGTDYNGIDIMILIYLPQRFLFRRSVLRLCNDCSSYIICGSHHVSVPSGLVKVFCLYGFIFIPALESNVRSRFLPFADEAHANSTPEKLSPMRLTLRQQVSYHRLTMLVLIIYLFIDSFSPFVYCRWGIAPEKQRSYV
ncbi:unnamed protein product [Arabis nemorensis]|uniref:Uncharacterized protein n=1 Tax=Arabis nemorensis TaxID=586526 RepID=A0A565BVK1_9BRAS|nr:unnamed protein product [Arabis nemorensis]